MIPTTRAQVVYSQGVRFAGGGIGSTAYHAVHGLVQQNMLAALLCGSFNRSDIPQDRIYSMGFVNRALRKLAQYDPSDRIAVIQTSLYDTWASRHIKSADLLHVWNNYGLRSIQVARDMGLRVLVERASSHPRTQADILNAEFIQRHLPRRINPAGQKRAEAELESADYILVPSEFAYESFISQGFNPAKLKLLPFGVDINYYHPVAKDNREVFRVLFIGQIGLRKGIPYLLEAWKRLRWLDAELVLVGSVDASLKSYPHQFDVPGVVMPGYQKNPLAAFQNADVFVFPSLEEGSALVTYEALACGLPVITTYQSGSVVRDEQDGWIVPAGNAEQLAECLQRLRSDNALCQQMAASARARACEYSWERYESSYANVCNELVTTTT